VNLPATGALAERRARWAVLAGLTLVSFLLLLDDTAVSVALPSIRRQLGLGLSGLEWVVNGYTLPLAALMLLAGQLADRHGRRRMFLIGLAVFTLASLLAGIAADGATLIAARGVQGIGAALVAPASLAIIADTFPDDERGWALGVWAGVTATALGLGPLLGALVTESLGWAWIFLLNVPLGVGAWLIARGLLPESHTEHREGHLDLAGVLSSGVGLSGLLLALTEANDYGWGSPRVLALGATAAAAFIAFVCIERRASDPLLDLSLMRRRSFAGPNVVILLATSVMCSLFFFLALYFQTVLGYSALAAGAELLPLTGAIVLVAPLAGRLADRIGAKLPVTVGMLALAAALLGLAGVRVNSSAWSLMPWLALAGVGIGLTTTPTTTAAMSGISAERHGIAAGVLNTFRATGLALGIAVMGAILTSFGGGATHRPAAFVEGFSTAVTINAAIALAAAITAALTLRFHLRRAGDAQEDTTVSEKPPAPPAAHSQADPVGPAGPARHASSAAPTSWRPTPIGVAVSARASRTLGGSLPVGRVDRLPATATEKG
jgi:EmrB/QacA subfamily drug resistance transporter